MASVVNPAIMAKVTLNNPGTNLIHGKHSLSHTGSSSECFLAISTITKMAKQSVE